MRELRNLLPQRGTIIAKTGIATPAETAVEDLTADNTYATS
jgi:hypothetical protein